MYVENDKLKFNLKYNSFYHYVIIYKNGGAFPSTVENRSHRLERIMNGHVDRLSFNSR
jgi:hypothetical protein